MICPYCGQEEHGKPTGLDECPVAILEDLMEDSK